MKNRKCFLRWLATVLGTFAAINKAAEAKQPKAVARRMERTETAPQLREADVLGAFRLGYVDCLPYTGPEQLIFIEPDGAIECFQEEAIPGLSERANRSFKRRELGRLRTGSLLKGEVHPAPTFQSKADGEAPVSGAKIQLVSMPGGPGVWFAMKAEANGLVKVWDEVYVRASSELLKGVRV